MAQTLFAILSKMLFLCGVTILLIFPGAHCFQNRKMLDATALAGSFSTSTGSQSPPSSNSANSAGAQGAAQATIDQGEAGAKSESATNTPDYFLNGICQKPTAPTTAEALSEAFAAGENSAISKAASKAVAMAGEQCRDSLKIVLAGAKSLAQSTGKGDALVSAAAKSEAEAPSISGQLALVESISGSRASNDNGSAEGTATAQASGQGAKTSTQTQSTVGPNSVSSSSSSFATAG